MELIIFKYLSFKIISYTIIEITTREKETDLEQQQLIYNWSYNWLNKTNCKLFVMCRMQQHVLSFRDNKAKTTCQRESRFVILFCKEQLNRFNKKHALTLVLYCISCDIMWSFWVEVNLYRFCYRFLSYVLPLKIQLSSNQEVVLLILVKLFTITV